MTYSVIKVALVIFLLFAGLHLLSYYPVKISAASSTSGLVAYYPFNGDEKDYSGNSYHGTNKGAAFIEGFSGQALSFDGKDDYVSAPVNINPGVMPQMTMTAWVRAKNDSPSRQVISHDNGSYDRSIGIDYRGGGTGWSCFSGSGSVLGYEKVVLGEWVFIATVYDQTAAKVRLYVNEATHEETGTLGSGWDYINIGRNPSFGEYFAGDIDDVRIYDRALSADEVDSIRVSPGVVPEITPTPSHTPVPTSIVEPSPTSSASPTPPSSAPAFTSTTPVITTKPTTPTPAYTPVPAPIPSPMASGLIFESRSKPTGGTIQIPLMLKGTAGKIGNMDLTLNYDPAVLRAEKAIKGSLSTNSLFDFNLISADTIKISLADKAGFEGDGSVAYVVFNIMGQAGDSSSLEIRSATANLVGYLTPVNLTTQDGVFTVQGTGQLKGDFNGDGKLTPLDALAALQMAVGKRAEEAVMDVNNDGKVTSIDASQILKEAVSQIQDSGHLAPEVTLRTLSSEQLQIVEMFGWPHSFSLVGVVNAEGRMLCSETWVYYDGQTSYLFLDGVYQAWAPVEALPGDSIAVPYTPDAFTIGSSIQDVKKALAPGDTLERIDDYTAISGDTVEGSEMYAAPQLLAFFYQGRLIYLEGITLVPQGGE
ncbi:MAG: hypothetical protein JXA46_15135 [Dehalococcoidales bacterium]|nr:hypothetical protein [Dehalococcoidales bacterium]